MTFIEEISYGFRLGCAARDVKNDIKPMTELVQFRHEVSRFNEDLFLSSLAYLQHKIIQEPTIKVVLPAAYHGLHGSASCCKSQ